MNRLFLDANVLFTAAHNPQGKSAFLLQQAGSPSRPWCLLSSAYAIEEARRNLRAKFPDTLTSFEQGLACIEVVAQPAAVLLSLALPEKDLPIWAAAHAAGATHLLTGDLRDFGPLMNRPQTTGGVTIQTVAEYLRDPAAGRGIR
jgi:hypothetical protein